MNDFSDNTNHPHDIDEQETEYKNSEYSSSSGSSFNVFAQFAKSLGVFSIFCCIFSMFMGTFICGGLAVILAVLSKGYDVRLRKNARLGLVTGMIAIVFQSFMFAVNVYSIIYNPEYREQFYSVYEQIYGEPLEDSLNELFEQMDLPEMKGGNL